MSNRQYRREVLSGLAVGGIGGLAGCLDDVPGLGSRDDDDGPATDRTLKLGLLHPLSGDLENVGAPIQNAAKLPVEQLRNADVPFEFDVEEGDTETSPRAGVSEALRLVRGGYPAVNGALASGVTLQATQQVLIPYRTVCCSAASTSPTITAINDVGLVFRTAVSDSLQAVALARMAAEQEGHASAATLYVNNDYGYQLSRAFARSFEGTHGGDVSAQVPFEQAPEDGNISYADQVEAALADDPDVLVLIGYPDSGALLLRDIDAAGADVSIMMTEGMQSDEMHESVDRSLAGIRGTAPLSGGPGEEFFADLYEETYEGAADSTPFNAHSYDATAVLLLANAFAGQNDGEAIRSAMHGVTSSPGERIEPSDLDRGFELVAAGENVEYVGASSDVRFDDNGDVAAAAFAYWEYQDDGSIEQLDTVEL